MRKKHEWEGKKNVKKGESRTGDCHLSKHFAFIRKKISVAVSDNFTALS